MEFPVHFGPSPLRYVVTVSSASEPSKITKQLIYDKFYRNVFTNNTLTVATVSSSRNVTNKLIGNPPSITDARFDYERMQGASQSQ